MRANVLARNPLAGAFLSEYFVLLLTVILFVALAPFAAGLVSSESALNIVAYLIPLFIAGAGLTIVLITGGIDLSIPAVIALTSVVGARLMTGESSVMSVAVGVGGQIANITRLRKPHRESAKEKHRGERHHECRQTESSD